MVPSDPATCRGGRSEMIESERLRTEEARSTDGLFCIILWTLRQHCPILPDPVASVRPGCVGIRSGVGVYGAYCGRDWGTSRDLRVAIPFDGGRPMSQGGTSAQFWACDLRKIASTGGRDSMTLLKMSGETARLRPLREAAAKHPRSVEASTDPTKPKSRMTTTAIPLRPPCRR